MKLTVSRRALFISTAVFSLAVTVSGLPAIALAADGTIKLGLVAPMSGPNARYGAFSMHGAELAVKDINDAGGIDGMKIELLNADSQGTPVEGVSAARRLIDQDGVDFIIGDVSSSVTLAIQPVAEDAEVLLLNAASSNPKITYQAGVGGFKWTYRNYPTDENRALIVAKYAAEQRGFTKFAVLSVDSDYGRSAITFTKKYLPDFKGEILSEDYYKEGEVDFRSVLAKIRDNGAQAIIMYGLADTTPIIARQMIELGIAGKVTLIGNGEFNTEKTIKSAPSALEGAVEAAAWLPQFDSPESKAFVEKFTATYNEAPNNHAYVHWDTVNLLAAAIKQAGSADKVKVRDALSKIKYKSPVGEVTFDDHNQARLPMILLQIENGKPSIKGAYTADIQYPAN
ncbi:ABC transporter substrate-binding protein [Rhizobium brockwellii]|jgi:branched-chain amino acid transport system substrate-binding protein|uniref:ABC transporter substrate-binding protein n=1 Tax=Rhizobium brockwellii TaxID=3019932 RepID=A0ABU3YL71_9HYPH|nr:MULTISPECIES: ABC transporter substrate-binding protein [Rhizobium]QND17578.1 ABC transporter substrate-binding protein [Rhizobium leguminosarum bv. trifolii]KPN23739.1 ABC transporter substrate-binding protein [Rhizobium brockwellii]MDV4154802.1 ABC transporter substrate-binding protein [Rhizobium brockwellii]MDV4179303.1 ABC transporter substrate-binding protein [Rhizobium brockwellii]MDV4186387.1 ABC transporter substrate-binding protein [Rhizobium brockwellii]